MINRWGRYTQQWIHALLSLVAGCGGLCRRRISAGVSWKGLCLFLAPPFSHCFLAAVGRTAVFTPSFHHAASALQPVDFALNCWKIKPSFALSHGCPVFCPSDGKVPYNSSPSLFGGLPLSCLLFFPLFLHSLALREACSFPGPGLARGEGGKADSLCTPRPHDLRLRPLPKSKQTGPARGC